MGQSNNRRSGPAKTSYVDHNKMGIKVDPGPYVATVMEIVKGNRLGQLRVSIPEWAGDTSAGDNYITVSYCSPFYGKTFGTDSQQLPDSPATSGQSYGMWMVPPDIGNKVLVIFANGDRGRGYWIGCVYDSPSHHMVPANGRAIGGSNKTLAPTSALSSNVGNDSNVPVAEYNTAVPGAFADNALAGTPRQPHEYQLSVLIRQGLDRDKVRGAISSSSMRESPSNVYGISTPGRNATGKTQVPGTPDAVIFRTGGHSFVMDDGAAGDDINKAGTDQLIRLRTAGGHQILMNDTENVLYIASNTGNQWLEFSADGAMNIYAGNGFNLRTRGVMNFHSDAAIIMQSPIIEMNASDTGSGGSSQCAIVCNTTGSFIASAMMGASIRSDGPLALSSLSMGSFNCGATLNLSSVGLTSVYGSLLKLNTGFPGVPSIVTPSPVNNLQDTEYSNGNWFPVNGKLQTACTVAPSHEPWVGDDKKSRPLPQIPGQGGSSLASIGAGIGLTVLGASLARSLF